jgi:hypothetical protein
VVMEILSIRDMLLIPTPSINKLTISLLMLEWYAPLLYSCC